MEKISAASTPGTETTPSNPSLNIRAYDVLATVPNNTHPQWWKDKGITRLNLRIGVILMSLVLMGYDTSLIGNLLVSPRWYADVGIDKANSSELGLVVAGLSFGAMVVFPFVGWALNFLGRKKMIMIGDVIVLAGVLGQTFCFANSLAYIFTRFLLGVGTMVMTSTAPILVTEVAHPRQRAVAAATSGIGFYLGSFLAAWIAFFSLYIPNQWSWRLPTALQIVLPALQFLLMYFVPESPRWLVSKGRHSEALNMLATYHGNGDKEDPLVRFEFEQIKLAISKEQEFSKSDSGGPLGAYRFLFATRGGFRRLIIILGLPLIFSWGGGTIVAYYFSLALDEVGITMPAQQSGINCGLQTLNFVAGMISASFVERAGRRPLWFASTGTMLLAMVGMIATSASFQVTGSTGTGIALVVMFFLYQVGVQLGHAPMTLMYVAEVCTFEIRAYGLSLHILMQYSYAAAAQYANPVALTTIGWRYYGLCIAILTAGLVVIYFYFPETSGLTIEEIAQVFDGEQKMERRLKGRRHEARPQTEEKETAV